MCFTVFNIAYLTKGGLMCLSVSALTGTVVILAHLLSLNGTYLHNRLITQKNTQKVGYRFPKRETLDDHNSEATSEEL